MERVKRYNAVKRYGVLVDIEKLGLDLETVETVFYRDMSADNATVV